MKYLLTIFVLILSLSLGAQDTDCNYPLHEPTMDPENVMMLQSTSSAIKREFKRRPMNINGIQLALSIETNFDAPIIGKDTYWGRIYLRDSDSANIIYRDELLAEKNYRRESERPSTFIYSTYKVSDINSSRGLNLVDGGGAQVNVKSVGQPFSTSRGGRLTIRVKAPNQGPRNITLDIGRSQGRITKHLIVNNQRIPFDSFKINAKKNFLGVTTILAGVSNIQFYSNGRVVHTL